MRGGLCTDISPARATMRVLRHQVGVQDRPTCLQCGGGGPVNVWQEANTVLILRSISKLSCYRGGSYEKGKSNYILHGCGRLDY